MEILKNKTKQDKKQKKTKQNKTKQNKTKKKNTGRDFSCVKDFKQNGFLLK